MIDCWVTSQLQSWDFNYGARGEKKKKKNSSKEREKIVQKIKTGLGKG